MELKFTKNTSFGWTDCNFHNFSHILYVGPVISAQHEYVMYIIIVIQLCRLVFIAIKIYSKHLQQCRTPQVALHLLHHCMNGSA
jgi:hypothetical protein